MYISTLSWSVTASSPFRSSKGAIDDLERDLVHAYNK